MSKLTAPFQFPYIQPSIGSFFLSNMSICVVLLILHIWNNALCLNLYLFLCFSHYIFGKNRKWRNEKKWGKKIIRRDVEEIQFKDFEYLPVVCNNAKAHISTQNEK